MKIVRKKRNLWLICLLSIAGIFLISSCVYGLPKKEPLSYKALKNEYEIGGLLWYRSFYLPFDTGCGK